MASRPVYRSLRRKLVLAFDVGTTLSGISYSILDPGQVPEVKAVTIFPALEHICGPSKIPSIIYYDRMGRVRAVGAEAMKEGIYKIAEEEQWIKAEWQVVRFKLHLRSKVGAGRNLSTDNIPPLPLNKSAIDVFADFLQYLLQCATTYIQDTHANGVALWASFKGEIDFVLSHPNGWEGTQQQDMRKAAVQAKLIPDNTSGHARLAFVTEGEASLQCAIRNGLPVSAMEKGDGVMIIDAGNGTIDISSYCKSVGASMGAFEEIAVPQRYAHGSMFVSIRARLFLQQYLEDSSFIADLDQIITRFDETTKLRFKNAEDPQYVKFGSPRDNDEKHKIRFGQLILQGSDVALFFEPSINCIVKSVVDQRRDAHKPIRHVVLVGEFAASDYLFSEVQAKLAPTGLNVLRPDNHLGKVVSDGAVLFYLDNFVHTRVSKLTYGGSCRTPFSPAVPDHQVASMIVISISGTQRINGFFDVIMPKMPEMKEFRRSYVLELESKHQVEGSSFNVWCYLPEPKWKDVATTDYTRPYTIQVDLCKLPLAVRPKPEGGTFYQFDFDIVLLFGLTECKAFVAWKERGIEKRSVTQIVYDPDIAND